jgi:hypothetical protein
MPLVIVLSSPAMEIYAKDSTLGLKKEGCSPGAARRAIARALRRGDRFIVGESHYGGPLAIARDRIAFVEYVTEQKLRETIEKRKAKEAALSGSAGGPTRPPGPNLTIARGLVRGIKPA